MRRLVRRAVRTLTCWGFAVLRVLIPVWVVPQWLQSALRAFVEREKGVLTRRDLPPLVLVFDAKGVCRVLADYEKFRVYLYEKKMRETFGPFLLGLDFDSQEYARQSELLRGVLRPDDCDQIRALAREAATFGVQHPSSPRANDGGGSVDLVSVAQIAISRFTEDYFGVREIESAGRAGATLLGLCQRTASYIFNVELLTGHLKADAEDAGQQIREHLLQVIREKREAAGQASGDTVVDRLVKTDAARWTDDELCTVLGGTILGLLVPTTSQYLDVMDRLFDLSARDLDTVRTLALEHHRQRDAGAPVDNLLERHVLEAARFSPFPPGLIRHCPDGVVLEAGSGRRVAVPANATVIAVTLAVAFDPRLAPHPGTFLAGRPASQYLVFGTGQHQCVAATPQRPIATILMTEMVAAVFSLRNVRRAPGLAGTLRRVKSRWPTSFQLVFD